MNLFGFFRRFFRFVRKRRDTAFSVTDESFTSLVSWAGSWAILSPKTPHINPIVVAEKVIVFVRAVARREELDPKALTAQIVTPKDLSQSDLVIFYIQQFPDSLSVFDRCRPEKSDFVSFLSAAVECRSVPLAMNALVQTLFWQVWYYLKYASSLDPDLAMQDHYDSFLAGAKLLSGSIP